MPRLTYLLLCLALCGCGRAPPGPVPRDQPQAGRPAEPAQHISVTSSPSGSPYRFTVDTSTGACRMDGGSGPAWIAGPPPGSQPGPAGTYQGSIHYGKAALTMTVLDRRTGTVWSSSNLRLWRQTDPDGKDFYHPEIP